MKKYTYDAFISYSHNEKDAFAAEQLHKILEHYHIPKRIQQSSGKKKIERVFRDQEEMPISFNLASNIQEALDQSEFLILMCSPNSIKSEWVQREVETFLKSHSKEQVLTVLLEGEPGICTSQNDGGSGWCCRCGSGFYDICISPVRKDQ